MNPSCASRNPASEYSKARSRQSAQPQLSIVNWELGKRKELDSCFRRNGRKRCFRRNGGYFWGFCTFCFVGMAGIFGVFVRPASGNGERGGAPFLRNRLCAFPRNGLCKDSNDIRHSRASGNPAYESFLRKQESSIRVLEGTISAIRPAATVNCQLGIEEKKRTGFLLSQEWQKEVFSQEWRVFLGFLHILFRGNGETRMRAGACL